MTIEKPRAKITKHLERKTYDYNGIAVHVEIDYAAGKISLIETGNAAKTKQWVFAGRGVEYMGGWQLIFDAMKYATGEATKELLAHQKKVEKQKQPF